LRFRAASDQAVLVYLGDEISVAGHQRVVRLLHALQREPLPWVQNLQPAYCSLLISYDASQVELAEVESVVRQYQRRAEHITLPEPKRIDIPVCYGGEFGSDLADVAALHGLTTEQTIKLHTSQIYRAYFLGFSPGFAYLGDLPDELVTPRLATPRKKVAPGSVAIAGKQTAIYPFATPGGWRLLGRTPVSIFRTDRNPMGLISVGDEVRFFPITPAEFASWEKS
jgi:KipI family sensor histidine kinase inhibitor